MLKLGKGGGKKYHFTYHHHFTDTLPLELHLSRSPDNSSHESSKSCSLEMFIWMRNSFIINPKAASAWVKRVTTKPSHECLTVQLLHRNDVIPAEDQAAAEFPVVRRHQSVTHRGVLQSQRVADLVGSHHEQVVAFVSIKRPLLCHVEVGFPSPREESVSQGSP